MRFEMRFVRGHVEVYDGEGRFLFSASYDCSVPVSFR